LNIGIIAEDRSDVMVIKELTLKLVRPHPLGFKSFVGDGCGKVQRKCAAWAANLVLQGCRWIAVVHDLDTNREPELRARLMTAVTASNADAHVVVIPKREIEAWLLYDPNAIAAVFRRGKFPRLPGDPESLVDPKRHLGELVWRTYRKDYLNTIHNPQIASKIDVARLNGCVSFAPYPGFSEIVRTALLSLSRTRDQGAIRSR
jgi:hypothetical protein